MARWLGRRWFLVILAATLVVGLTFWAPLAPLAAAAPQTAIVAVVMFLMAASVEASHFARALRQPRAVCLGVAINAIALPLLAWPVAGLLRQDLAYGLLVAAAIPSTLTSAAVWTRQAGGDDTVAILITLVTNGLCFLVTPAWLYATTGAAIEINPWAMVVDLALAVVLPLVLGQLARLWMPFALVVDRRKSFVSGLAQVGILAIIGVGAVFAGQELASHANSQQAVRLGDWAAMLAAVVGLHTAALVLGHATAMALGLPRAERIAVGFSGSQKTLMVGLRTALATFGGLAMLPTVAFHVCQLLVDTVVADWLRRRTDSQG